MNNELQAILKSKWATAGLALFLVMVLAGSSKLFMQKSEVSREIRGLQEKAGAIQKENDELTELIKYLNTKEYSERAARDKLNLKKEGEVVVSIPAHQENGEVAGASDQQMNNLKKWYNYFFDGTQ